MPGGTRRNLQYLMPRMHFDPCVADVDQLLLSDAQTSGGLLFAVEPSVCNDLLLALEQAQVRAALIGEITELPAGRVQVVTDSSI